jgi:hypothetical protein
MKYQMTIFFNEGISKEEMDYFVASLKYKKFLLYQDLPLPVENVWLAVAGEPPEEDE